MIVIGLTGGIASGKTTITNFLKKKKFALHDSDSVVKKIYSIGKSTLINFKLSKKYQDYLVNKGSILMD